MSAIEAAGYGIPCVHVDTPHVREGIGDGAILVPGQDVEATAFAIDTIERNYDAYAYNARKRAEWIDARQIIELERFAEFIDNVRKPMNTRNRQKGIDQALRRR
jgi:hypothetical protein